MDNQSMVCFQENFLGGTLPATQEAGSPWDITDTSSAGAPTYVIGTDGAVLTLASNTEIENVCLAWGDQLTLDIDDLDHIEFLVKTSATLDTATTIVCGLASARNDDPDAITASAFVKLDGSNVIVAESDDGTNDNDDVATGQSLVAAFRRVVISFAAGKSDVRFFIDGKRVAASTTFDMSNYAAGLQPYFQIQKTSDSNTDSLTIGYVRVEKRQRAAAAG